ncbi:hypothetical protein FNF27_05990 [Cafeteria roenbergensis]|uniref:Uncharacterized protein n=1 Tax=Cafeteria roenbergensis TaxID=33653 RepID=A0A5A8E403_CAFRO|nr:hypothetical protein FNF27_05990 [Cafeteria roenbergensis]
MPVLELRLSRVEFENYLLEKDSSPLMHLEIWDTSGRVESLTIVQKFFTRADGAMLVFDLTSAKSFDAMKLRAKELGATGRDDVAMVVCGNKCDLVEEDPGKREVESDLAIAYADEIGAGYFEVSALTGANVREAFVRLAEDVLRRRRARASDEPPAPAEPVEKGAKPGGGNCCCS